MGVRQGLAAFVGSVLLSFAAFAAEAPSSVPGDPLPRAKPEDVGMSSERLARIGAALKEDIDRGLTPGGVIAIARRGKLVALEAYGWRDKAAGVAMTTDTIFNIASMTKPMTTVGALMLYEQGRLLMDDPLAKYFPKFADMRVAARDAQGQPTTDTVPAGRKITIQDLPRHTSGLIYGGRGTTLVHKQYPDGSGAIATGMSGEQFLDKLASLPLLYQPGTVWDYGFGLDVLGLVVEKISGQRLGQYLQANLWTPLGMSDTGFYIPPDKAARYAKALPNDPVTGKPQSVSPVLTQKLDIRVRRRVRGIDRERLSALCADAYAWRTEWRSAHPWPQDGRVHAVRSARTEGHQPDRQCRSDARRFRLRPRSRGQADHGHHPADGIGRARSPGRVPAARIGGPIRKRISPWSTCPPRRVRSAGTTARRSTRLSIKRSSTDFGRQARR